MINIFDLPLFYISFKQNDEIEKNYKKNGFTNVNHFQAVNGRKFNADDLMSNNIITIRSYNDLKNGRREHSGMPSLGAIGCTLSHYELWKLCVKNNWPAIIIAEEDNVISKPLTTEDIENISNTLNKPNGVFLSAKRHNYENDKNHFTGTHFYFATQDACKAMIKNCFPIDVQTDWYIKHLGNQKEINLEGYEISNQKNRVGTSIQDSCFICNLPKNNSFYIFIIALCIVILFIFIGLIYLKNKK